MAITILEHSKETITMSLDRLRGSGEPAVTVPERRILNAARTVVTGFDWAAATYTAATREISALFDSTLAGLNTPATYFMQFRLTIGNDRKVGEVEIILKESGP